MPGHQVARYLDARQLPYSGNPLSPRHIPWRGSLHAAGIVVGYGDASRLALITGDKSPHTDRRRADTDHVENRHLGTAS